MTALAFLDGKHLHGPIDRVSQQDVAGFPDQVGNVDAGERVGAEHPHAISRTHAGQLPARAQHGHGASEALQVEVRVRRLGAGKG